jgi:1-deoxy-D-xylulose-5-phosphate reductoisomerase
VLFEVPADKVQIVVHPQSIIHSMVEYVDSSIIAQLSNPDMCLPIVYALFWPDRAESAFGRIDWNQLQQLTFEKPDCERFPAIALAYEVARAGGTAPAVYNAANEIAVAAFLDRRLGFTQIADIVKGTTDSVESTDNPSLGDILEADRQAREVADKLVTKTT